MNKLSRYIVMFSLIGMLALPSISSAQTLSTSQLQAQIQSLLVILQSLQQQLAARQGSVAQWCYTFNANLKIGASGSGVTALQTALQKENLTVSITGNYDDQTASAVSGFQEKYASTILAPNGLQYGTGYAGVSTRAKLNSLYGCGNTTVPVMPAPTPIIPTTTTPYVLPPTSVVPPTVTFSANGSSNPISVAPRSQLTLSWGSTNAVSCYASGNWSGTLPTSGSQTLATPYSTTAVNYVYSVNCSGSTGLTATSNVYVSVAGASFSGGTTPAPVAVGSLTVATSDSLPNQTAPPGTTGLKIGSYSLSASSTENVTLTNVKIQVSGSYFQNLRVKLGTDQFGTTQATVTPGTPYVFSGPSANVGAGGAVTIDVYADTLLSGTGTIAPATTFVGFTATGARSGSSILFTGNPVSGQSLTFAGTPALSIGADSTNPPAGQVALNTVRNPLAAFRFAETANAESIKITDLKIVDVVDSTATTNPSFNNLQLWGGSSILTSAGSPVTDAAGAGYIYSFHFVSPMILPQANSMTLTLRGDVASDATPGSIHRFAIMTTSDPDNNTPTLTVAATGQTSGRTPTITISDASGNPQTIAP